MATPLSPDITVVIRSNEIIHHPTTSDQCFLLEKAEEIFKSQVPHIPSIGAAGTNFQGIGNVKGEFKDVVRQIDDFFTPRQQLTRDRIVPPWQDALAGGDAIDKWDKETGAQLWCLDTNFDYIKFKSFGGYGAWKGNRQHRKECDCSCPKINEIEFIDRFFEITPAEKAQLAHYCNISSNFYDKEGKLKEDLSNQINFQNETDLSYLTTARSKKQLAGLVSVDIIHEGIDSVTRNVILVNATFIFQDLGKLMEEPYSQLLQLGTFIPSSNSYRYIEFELGWDTANSKLKKDLKLEKLGLKLRTNLIKYTFDLKEDGSVIVNAQYRGQVTDKARNPASNILQLAKTVFESIKNDITAINQGTLDIVKRIKGNLETFRARDLAVQLFRKLLLNNFRVFFSEENPTGVQGRSHKGRFLGVGKGTILGELVTLPNPGGSTPFSAVNNSYGDAVSAVTQTETRMKLSAAQEMARIARAATGANAVNAGVVETELKKLLDSFFRGQQSGSGVKGVITILQAHAHQSGGLGTTIGHKDFPGAINTGKIAFNIRSHGKVTNRSQGQSGGSLFSQIEATMNQFIDISGGGGKAAEIAKQATAEAKKLADMEAQIKNSFKVAVSQAMKHAFLARFRALQEIARGLLKNLRVFNVYLTTGNIQDIKEAAIDPDKTRLADVVNKIKPPQYLNARAPSGLSLLINPLTKLHKSKQGAQWPAKPGKPKEFFEFEEKDLDEFQVIPFVFLGDLLRSLLQLPTDIRPLPKKFKATPSNPNPPTRDSVLDRILNDSGQRFYVDLGKISYTTPMSSKDVDNFRLYYFPISLKRVNDFFSREIVGKEKSFYSFYDFVQGIVTAFITNAFAGCAKEAQQQDFVSPKIEIAVFEEDSQPEEQGSFRAPVGTYPGSTSIFIYGSKNVKQDLAQAGMKQKKFFGDYAWNLERGIYHFFLGGRDKGIAKSVKVIDIADPATKTAVYYDAGRASERGDAQKNVSREGAWAPVVFQANIETLAWPLFQLGQLIYVDLRPFIGGDLSSRQQRQFSANGYYGIKKIEYSFTPDSFTSRINAIIQFSTEDAVAALTGQPRTKSIPTGGKSPATAANIRATLKQAKELGDKYKVPRDRIVKVANEKAKDLGLK